ncbi:leucine-rich repeat protein [Treponema pedis]|uniref:Surface protein n=2 Tax=Treponema pedis TaxID=409322 RepID=S5ZLU5_9SPIR|nr:leucine-rich repeat protein [Treponema pedis]AGT43552.1 surface protein [Treponema pedis str. T A4]QSI04345.1 hypothetical protein DYQ05_05040 [Treponema pedis]
MKQSKRKSFVGAVIFTALVLVAGLLAGCPNGAPKNTNTSNTGNTGNAGSTGNTSNENQNSIFKLYYGTIAGYTCKKEELPSVMVIPHKVRGWAITGIGQRVFENCTGITSLDLSACTALFQIGHTAFSGCTGLTNVDLSACTLLTAMSYDVFCGCTNAEIKLPESITLILGHPFGSKEDDFCKKVLIKSGPNFERIKELLVESGYPEERIGQY